MIIILDCGSQLTHNIARRVRESRVYCEVLPYSVSLDDIKAKKPEGIIISGSPVSVHDDSAVFYDKGVFGLGVPVLGMCYGMQSMAIILGGKVEKSKKREYGYMKLKLSAKSPLFETIPDDSIVWMSHGDRVIELPPGFSVIARSDNSDIAAMASDDKQIYGVQFHPEVDHTEYGRKLLSNFVEICGCRRSWTPARFVENAVKEIREKAGDSKVIGGVSGGVDSTVASMLMHKAIGDNFIPLLINNGLMRLNEVDEVLSMFSKNMGMELDYVDASERFLQNLRGVLDPEEKRKIIGRTFIEVFQEEAEKQENLDFLMQGTLYPDVIESMSVFGGPSSTIKSHHNVGGLPEKMHLKLIEPLRYLFKDEVRKAGEELGLPKEAVWRHPFPGPGLGIRIIGEITEEKLDILRQADHIFISELKKNSLYYDGATWQAFAILTGSSSVGVMGDERTYEDTIGLRAVTSKDGMTADWARLPQEVLARVSNRIINEIKGVNRVVYDITSKPPGTIEWE